MDAEWEEHSRWDRVEDLGGRCETYAYASVPQMINFVERAHCTPQQVLARPVLKPCCVQQVRRRRVRLLMQADDRGDALERPARQRAVDRCLRLGGCAHSEG